jgi:hypothetical protein
MGWNNPTRLSIGGHFNVWRCPISGSRDRVVLGSLHDRGGRARSVIAARSGRQGPLGHCCTIGAAGPARSLLPDRGRDQSAAPPTARSTCGSKPANAADNGREWRAQQLHEGAEYKEALAHAQRSAIPGQPLAGLAQAYDCPC